MRKKIFSRLSYTWWIYILTAIVLIGFWILIFNQLAKPAANEKLFITIVGNGVQSEKLQSDLEKKLPDISQQNLKEVTVENMVYESDYTLTNSLWARSLDADIIIITNTAMFEGIGESYFLPLDVKKTKELFGDVTFYKENGTAYGILLYDGENANTFSNYYAKEKCWLFFTAEGKNTGGLNGKGNAKDDAAVQTAKWFLS